MLALRIDPIERDVRVLVNDNTNPKAISAAIAGAAREALAEALEINTRAIGYAPHYDTFVDGVLGAPLDNVRRVIVFDFDLVTDAILWIHDRLKTVSPVLTGEYKRKHLLYADGREVPPDTLPPPALEYVFLDEVPYARKIERGLSKQAPEGVYQVVAADAAARFKKLARIRFSYREFALVQGTNSRARRDARQPAIIISLR